MTNRADDLFHDRVLFGRGVTLLGIEVGLLVKVQKDRQAIVADVILVLLQLILSVRPVDGRLQEDVVVLEGNGGTVHWMITLTVSEVAMR